MIGQAENDSESLYFSRTTSRNNNFLRVKIRGDKILEEIDESSEPNNYFRNMWSTVPWASRKAFTENFKTLSFHQLSFSKNSKLEKIMKTKQLLLVG